MARPRLKRGWMVLGGALVLLGLIYASPALGRRLEFFRVRRIEVVGIRYLSADKIVEGMHLRRNASVFDDLDPVAARLRKMPGVDDAEVDRRLPGALRVTIREVDPVALVPQKRGMAMIDSTGQVLPFDPATSAPDLPVVRSADRGVARVLGRTLEFEPPLFAQISSAWRDHGDVVLEVDGRRYWFTPTATIEEIRAVMAVAQELNRQGRGFTELDGRFSGQVVVRGLRPAEHRERGA